MTSLPSCQKCVQEYVSARKMLTKACSLQNFNILDFRLTRPPNIEETTCCLDSNNNGIISTKLTPQYVAEKPLVLYVFSTSKKVLSNIVDNTSSGGMCVNDTMMHMGVETLPFGGVGSSGIGAYHGKKTFDTFTHKKSCLIKNFSPIGEKLASGRYPPYTDGNLNFISTLMRKRFGPSLKFVPYLLAFALGAGVSYGIFAWQKMASEE